MKTSAASLPCRSASSASNSTSARLVPEMLRVPPAPAHGGLEGRKVAPIYFGYDANSQEPIDQQAQSACAKWTRRCGAASAFNAALLRTPGAGMLIAWP